MLTLVLTVTKPSIHMCINQNIPFSQTTLLFFKDAKKMPFLLHLTAAIHLTHMPSIYSLATEKNLLLRCRISKTGDRLQSPSLIVRVIFIVGSTLLV